RSGNCPRCSTFRFLRRWPSAAFTLGRLSSASHRRAPRPRKHEYSQPVLIHPVWTGQGRQPELAGEKGPQMPNNSARHGWWTPERVTLLADLARSASARRVGEILGTTRCAVLGKAYRLGVSFRCDGQGEGDRRQPEKYDPVKRRARFLANREHNLAQN